MVNVIISVVNWLYSLLAFSQSVTYLAKSQLIVKHSFTIGWFINIYWLAFGLYFGWYGNIAITTYFVWLNYIGKRNWGGKPIAQGNLKWYALSAGMALTLAVNIYSGLLFSNIPSTINCFNCMLYAATYTFKALGPKYKQRAIIMQLINLVAYIPMVLMVQPILWGCAIRQTIAVGMYTYKLIGRQRLVNYFNQLAIAKMQYVTW